MLYEVQLTSGKRIGFESGKFDEWQVNVVNENGVKKAPLDVDYFNELLILRDLIGVDDTYKLFINIYDKVDKNVNKEVINFIINTSEEFKQYEIELDLLLMTLYYTMIAEENKKYTRLGKKIKRLGVHQVLKENFNIRVAANYSKGLGWRDIEQECRNRGF